MSMVNSSQPKKQSKKPPTTCTFFSHHASTKKHEPSSPTGEVLLDISATLSRVTGALNVPSPSCILFFIPMGHVPLCRLRISALDLLLALGWVGGKKECCPAMLPDPGSSELCLIPCGIHCEVAFPLEDGCTGSRTTFSNFRPSGTMEKKICVLFTSPSKNLHCVPLAQVWIRWWSLTGYWSVGIECSDWLKPNNMFTLKLDLEWMSLDPQNQE